MTSVLISSPSRMDNVFQGRAMPTTMPPQQWHGVSPQQQQQAQVKPTCGSRSRLLSLPIQSNDVIPSGYPCAEHQHAVTSSHQSYEAALRRQLLAASSSSSSTSSSFDDVNTSPGPIDVYQIAQALAHFGITPAAASTDCRPKAPLERSISMPVDATSPTSLKHLQLQQQQLQPQPPVNASRYKTEMCRPFEEHGFCKYGDKCQFAHGVQELRTVNRHPKYKTELCRTFHTVGFCAYGSRCHFVHNEEERAAAGPGPQQRASPPLPIMSKATSPAYQMPAGGNASGYGRHLPVVRCGSLGSTTDSSPPPSPVDLQSSSSVFFNNTSPSYVMTPSPVSPSTPGVLTLNDLSALIAGLRAGGVSPPSPTESMTYGSDGCYDVMSLSSSSAESSPTKCMPPSAFSAAAVGRIPNFSYYN